MFTRDITFVVYHRGVSLPDDSTLQEEYDISMRHFPRIRVGGGLKNVLCSVCASHVSEILEPRVGFPTKSPLSFRETNRETESDTMRTAREAASKRPRDRLRGPRCRAVSAPINNALVRIQKSLCSDPSARGSSLVSGGSRTNDRLLLRLCRLIIAA